LNRIRNLTVALFGAGVFIDSGLFLHLGRRPNGLGDDTPRQRPTMRFVPLRPKSNSICRLSIAFGIG
jgi:hypothetical protein